MKVLKHLLLGLCAAALLSLPCYAAVCGFVIESDGNACRECALGDLGADAVRACTHADIALLSAGELGIGLQPGPVDESDIAESFPTNGTVVVLEMNRRELELLLEQSLSHITLGEDERIDEAASAYDGFFCVSGMCMSFDASAPIGQRLYELTTESAADTLTVAVTAEYADGEAVCTLREAVTAYLDGIDKLDPPTADRIKALGANDSPIVGGLLSKGTVLVLAAVAFCFGGFRWRRRMRERTER